MPTKPITGVKLKGSKLEVVTKAPRSVSEAIRQKKSKRVKVARRGIR